MADSVKEAFGNTDIYAILGVDKTATPEQIKKAYFKKALLYHPDKTSDPEATKKFQSLSFIHSILSDPTKRKDYDRTGSLEDVHDGDEESFELWFSYWRNLFPTVTEEQIIEFEKTYRGSEEEKEDVLRAYTDHEGSMDDILDVVLCSREEDEGRFAKIILEGLDAGKVEPFPAFTKLYGKSIKDAPTAKGSKERSKATAARAARAAEEAAEAEKMLADMRKEHHKKAGKSADDSLESMILAKRQQRKGDFDSLLSSLESKYADKEKPSAAKRKPATGGAGESEAKASAPKKSRK